LSALTPIAGKLGKFIRLLSSDKDGEVVAAARAIVRALKAENLDIHALADNVNGEKRFSEQDAAEIYLRGLEEGRRQADRDGGFHNVDGPSWHEIALECHAHSAALRNPAEKGFVADMVRRTVHGGQPTEKQAKWLRDIYTRIRRPP
jgi:hypothetical protein